jgi:hypothetical protein
LCQEESSYTIVVFSGEEISRLKFNEKLLN